jgi:hypothetical protein
MLILGVVLSLLGAAAFAGGLWLYGAERRRLARRKQIEKQAAQAALEYLTKFGVRCATAAIAVGEGRLVILIETEPQKKLRFSYIVEQPLRDFVNKTTGLNVRWVYWRFPVPHKQQKVPEVKYGGSETIAMIDNRDVLPEAPAEKAEDAEAKAAGTAESEIDEYFQERSYQIEEVDWDQYNTLSGQPDAAVGGPKSGGA